MCCLRVLQPLRQDPKISMGWSQGFFYLLPLHLRMEHAYLSLHLCEKPRLYLSLSCITGQKGNSTEPPAHFRLDRTVLSDLGGGWCKLMLVCFCNHKHVLSQFMHCLPTDLRMTNVWSQVSEKLLRACIVFPVKVHVAGKHLRWVHCHTHLNVDWTQVWYRVVTDERSSWETCFWVQCFRGTWER